MDKSCDRASAIDLAAFLVDPHDPDFPDFAAFRQHYSRCTTCAAEVAKWTKLGQLLQESSEHSAVSHPSEELLVQFRHRPGSLPPADRQALEQHLQTCPSCRRELSLLRSFDFTRIQQWVADVERETEQEGPRRWIERSRTFFARLFAALQPPGWQPVFAAVFMLLLGIGIGRFFPPSVDHRPPLLQQILQEPDRGVPQDTPQEAISTLFTQYKTAYEARDTGALRNLWQMDAKQQERLAQLFASSRQLALLLDVRSVHIDPDGAHAVVELTQQIATVDKYSGAFQTDEPVAYRAHLRRRGSTWKILELQSPLRGEAE
jgi:hypothetical protein